MKGSVGTIVIMPLIFGVVTLFIGLFTLSTVEPLFNVTECSFSNTAGSPQIQINGSANESALQNYTVPTLYSDVCTLHVSVLNISANGGTLTVYEYPGTTAVATITNPITASRYFSVTPTSNAVYPLNYSYVGEGDLNITTASYVRCCTGTVYRNTPGGTAYDQTVTAIAVAFSVFGLVLIIYALASAIGALKSMTKT